MKSDKPTDAPNAPTDAPDAPPETPNAPSDAPSDVVNRPSPLWNRNRHHRPHLLSLPPRLVHMHSHSTHSRTAHTGHEVDSEVDSADEEAREMLAREGEWYQY